MTVYERPFSVLVENTFPANMTYALRDVVQQYGNRTVLRVATLDIRQGENLAVVGPSGAGKSTLLRLLVLLENPARGDIRLQIGDKVFNQRTATISQRRQIAMVFQHPALLSRSVWKNVAYSLEIRGEADVRSRVQIMLEKVSLGHLTQKPAHTLSGGEKQRVAIARALITQPQVLILDEPTANLDPQNIRIIEQLIHEQCEQTTVIMVTHNIFQAKRLADRVALLLDGKIIEIATNKTFFNTPRDPRTQAFISGDIIY
ncbi:MAG: phosphate ABC transporter ATP-binding protein [Chloroflexota bacterium]